MSLLSLFSSTKKQRDPICEYRTLVPSGLDTDTRIALGALHEINRTGSSATITADDCALIIKHILTLQESRK